MPDRVLVVEDSKVVAKLLSRLLRSELGVEAVVARNYAEAQELAKAGEYLAALTDLDLPDAPMGAAVDLLVARGYPVVVVTGDLGTRVQELMWQKRVADYFVKSDFDPWYLVDLIRRFKRNASFEVLVVDDSRVTRTYTVELLKRHRYPVRLAELPSEALRVLEQHPQLRLAIVDYNMPEMDGCALTRLMRTARPREQFAIIGISAQGSAEVSAKFIKNGANDFIHKPFTPDEFYCRVGLNVSMMESFLTIRETSLRDFLTGLYNRRHFYDVGKVALDTASKQGSPLAVAMLDIDRFKSVNDTYGHDAGDLVLKAVAGVLKSHAQLPSIPFRLGGEEFCILMPGMARSQVGAHLERIREALQQQEIPVGEQVLRVTASFGACCDLHDTLDSMLSISDECLYKAKESGRNRVILAPCSGEDVGNP